MQCDKTSSILNFCFCSCGGEGEQGRGGRQALGSVLTEERLTQPQPLQFSTLCLLDSMQPCAANPPPPAITITITITPQTLHPEHAARTTDNTTS